MEYAKSQLDATVIRAPVTGTILERTAEKGELVTSQFASGAEGGPRGSVVDLADLNDIQVELDIAQDDFAKLSPHQEGIVTLDAFKDRSYKGEIAEMSPEANRQKATVQVKVQILQPDSYLRPEMNATVQFKATANEDKARREAIVRLRSDRRRARQRRHEVCLHRIQRQGAPPRRSRQGRAFRRLPGRLARGRRKRNHDRARRSGGRAKNSYQGAIMSHSVTNSVQPAVGSKVVQARGVSKIFKRDAFEVTALDNVSIDIAAGEFLALMGPSGSGKTTLLNMIAAIDRPTSGDLLVMGDNIFKLNDSQSAHWRNTHVGYVFQTFNLIPVLTAFENVELPLLLTKMTPQQRRDHVMTALKLVGLEERVNHLPKQLSGGQEQRVAIARAIVSDPTLILADEPTGDLDSHSATEILEILKKLNQGFHKTIMMVTHDPHAAEYAHVTRHLERRAVAAERRMDPCRNQTVILDVEGRCLARHLY